MKIVQLSLAVRLLKAANSTRLTPEEGTAEEIFKNCSAVIVFHRFRAGNMNQRHTSCREASLAARLDVFIDLAKIREALNTLFGKNTRTRSFNSANCPCETNWSENRPCTWLPEKTPPSSSQAHPPARARELPGHRQGFNSSTLPTKN